jgi:hypothetical protein
VETFADADSAVDLLDGLSLYDPDSAAAWDVVRTAEKYVPKRWRHKNGRVCKQGDACNSRCCESCQWRVALHRTHAILPQIRYMGKRLLMFTLTRPAETNVLYAHRSAKRLVSDFAKLVRLPWWKSRIVGGVRNMHVGHGPDGWTPHLHLIVETCAAVDEIELSQGWRHVSADSYDVFVRKVGNGYHDRRRALGYSLGPSLRYLNMAQLRDFGTIANRVRGYGTFGTWRGFDKPTKDTAPPILIPSRLSRRIDDSEKTVGTNVLFSPDSF